MYLNKNDIKNLDRIYRLNVINSITGIKPANLIGTVSGEGIENLAIFSSVVHLGSNPPLIGMFSRPDKEVRRHTLENIKSNEVYTINHVKKDHAKQAHYTSAKFDDDESEFEKCGFTPEYLEGYAAPFVKESSCKIGLGLRDLIPIRTNNTLLIVGEILHLIVPDEIVDEKGQFDLTKMEGTGVSGLNVYYGFEKINQFPYARKEELPEFKKSV